MFTLSPEVLHQHQDVNRGVHRGIEDIRPSGEAVSGTSTLPSYVLPSRTCGSRSRSTEAVSRPRAGQIQVMPPSITKLPGTIPSSTLPGTPPEVGRLHSGLGVSIVCTKQV